MLAKKLPVNALKIVFINYIGFLLCRRERWDENFARDLPEAQPAGGPNRHQGPSAMV